MKELFVPTHGAVELNTAVGVMDDEAERLSLAQIGILKLITLLTRLRLDDGRLARARATNLLRRSAITDLINFRKEMLRESKNSFEVGEGRWEDITFSELALASAYYEAEALELEIAAYESQAAKGSMNLDQLEKLLAAQETLVTARQEELTFKSPLKGYLKWFIFPGGYIDQGELLAIVSSEPW